MAEELRETRLEAAQTQITLPFCPRCILAGVVRFVCALTKSGLNDDEQIWS